MAKTYAGVSGKARTVKSIYVGVNGKARKVTKAYAGVNGKARLVYTAEIYDIPAGTYYPGTFHSLASQFITTTGTAGRRQLAKACTVKVNGTSVSLSAGDYIYFNKGYVSGSGSAYLNVYAFGANKTPEGVAYQLMNFSTGKMYITGYTAGTGNYFPDMGYNYYVYPITITGGIKFV